MTQKFAEKIELEFTSDDWRRSYVAIINECIEVLRKEELGPFKYMLSMYVGICLGDGIITDTDAAKFRPVFDQYVKELLAINDKKFGLIQEFADNWGKLTNDQSLLFARNCLDMDIATAQLRQKYVPIVAEVLDGRKTAIFFQLDRRIATVLDYMVQSICHCNQ